MDAEIARFVVVALFALWCCGRDGKDDGGWM